MTQYPALMGSLHDHFTKIEAPPAPLVGPVHLANLVRRHTATFKEPTAHGDQGAQEIARLRAEIDRQERHHQETCEIYQRDLKALNNQFKLLSHQKQQIRQQMEGQFDAERQQLADAQALAVDEQRQLNQQDLDQQADKHQRRLKELEAKLTHQHDTIQSLNAARDALDSEHTAALSLIESQHAATLTELDATHRQALETQSSQHDEAMASLHNDHAAAIQQLNVQLDETHRRLEGQTQCHERAMQAIREEGIARLKAQAAEHDEHLAQQQHEHEQALASAEQTLQALDQQISTLQEQQHEDNHAHQQALKEQQAQHEEAIKQLRASLLAQQDAQGRHLHEDHHKALDNALRDQTLAFERERETYQQDTQRQQANLTRQLCTLQDAQIQLKKALRDQAREARDDLSKQRHALKYRARLERKEQARQITSHFQSKHDAMGAQHHQVQTHQQQRIQQMEEELSNALRAPDALANAHQAAMDALRQQHLDTINDLDQQWQDRETELQQQVDALDETLTQLDAEHARTLSHLDDVSQSLADSEHQEQGLQEELSRLQTTFEQTQREARQERDRLGAQHSDALNQQSEEIESRYQKRISDLQSEIAALQDTLDRHVEKTLEDQETHGQLIEQLDTTRRDHEAALAQQKADIDQHWQQLASQQHDALTQQVNDLNQQLEESRQRQQKAIEQAKATVRKRLTQEHHEALQEQADRLSTVHQEDRQLLIAEHQSECSIMEKRVSHLSHQQSQHREQLTEQARQQIEMRDSHAEALSAQQSRFDKKKTALQQSHREEIQALQQALDEMTTAQEVMIEQAKQALREEMATEHQADLAHHMNQLRDSLAQAHEKALSQQRDDADLKITSLESTLQRLEHDMERQAKRHRDAIEDEYLQRERIIRQRVNESREAFLSDRRSVIASHLRNNL